MERFMVRFVREHVTLGTETTFYGPFDTEKRAQDYADAYTTANEESYVELLFRP